MTIEPLGVAPDLGALTDDEQIGERVHQVMWRRKISQTDLAAKLDIHQSALSNKLRGKRPFFAREIIAIAGELDVNPAYLLGHTNNPHPGGPDGGIPNLRARRDSNSQPPDS